MHQLQEARREALTAPRARLLIITVASFILLLDQVTKAMALRRLSGDRSIEVLGDVLELRLVHNASSAFGLLAVDTIFITIASLVILVIFGVWALRHREHPAVSGLILGGGLGNIVDRFVRAPGAGSGSVVDFIDLSFWPTFNVADMAIVIGVGLLLLFSRRAPEGGDG